jgi:hypothetical protein
MLELGLLNAPTPVTAAPRLGEAIGLRAADLFIKRDDLIGVAGGGWRDRIARDASSAVAGEEQREASTATRRARQRDDELLEAGISSLTAWTMQQTMRLPSLDARAWMLYEPCANIGSATRF